ncbi:MAG: Na+/H+ antiporter subunit E [Pseudomonadota bacterium]|nr:Na+/H+ antiporter subunit E [Pseudomonadota bacterium]
MLEGRWRHPTLPQLRRLVESVAVLALAWAILTGNRGWQFGAPVVAGAALLNLLFSPARFEALRLPQALGLAAFFLKESLLGGLDVARRALHPRLPVQPAWFDYPLRLPAGPARTAFLITANLLPGTLSIALEGDVLTVHALSANPALGESLARLEARIGAVFGLRLEP